MALTDDLSDALNWRFGWGGEYVAVLPRPEGEADAAAEVLSRVLGYPGIVGEEVDLWRAAATLGMMASPGEGLGVPPPPDLMMEFEALLMKLGDGARFFADADYTRGRGARPPEGHPGACVAGVGAEAAFMVWASPEP